MTRTSVLAVAVALLSIAVPVRADVVLDWNVTMLTTLSGQNPFATARFAAITQLAVFEAVNAITGEYDAYLGTIVAPAGASTDAAAAAAAHAVLKYYFPAKATDLDAALAASLAAIPDGPAKADGIAVGEAAAAAMIARRVNDGSASATFYAPTSAEPGQWQVTPSCPTAGGTNYHWRAVTPFGVPDVVQFRSAPPPELTGGEYSKSYVEVKTLGAIDSVMRTPERADVVRFYASFSPVSWANSAVRQVSAAQGRSPSDNARALALVNMAISDAAVTVFDTKYYYTAWRPETAIHAGDTDGNHKTDADAAFLPFIVAPCFPGYPSAHGTLSSAASEVLGRLYGSSGHDITFSTAAVPGVTLHYTAFKDIVADVSDARVYGGIHFRFDQDAGERQGQRVGEYVFKNNLRAVHPD